MRENDTKVIGSMRRESLVYKGFQRFSALEVIRFLTMFTDFLFDGNSTYWQGGANRLTPLRHSQKEKCESLGSYTGTGFTSTFASFDFDTLDE